MTAPEQNNANDSNQPLTKSEFQEHLETLVNVVATKYDLKELEDQIADKITDSQDKILSSNDTIAKKLDTILAELPATTHRLHNHETRIAALEQRAT